MRGSRLVREIMILAMSVCGYCLLLSCPGQATLADEVFRQTQRLDTCNHPTAAVLADVTGDSFPDLLVACEGSNELAIFSGNGGGNLSPSGRFAAGRNPVSLAVGDYDEDDDLDIAIANHETQLLTVLVNTDGAGTFKIAPVSPLALDVRPHPHEVRARDMNQDGHLDLLIDNRHGRGFALYLGTGSGSFPGASKHVDAGGDPYLGMAIGDLNDDGRADIVAPLSNAITVVLSRDGSYSEPLRITSHGAFAVELADLNGDKKLDLIMATEPGDVSVLTGLGSGRFREKARWRTAAGAKRIAVGDFNADGWADIVVQNYLAPELFVVLGGAAHANPLALGAGKNPWGLAIADLNRDGRDDLVSLDYTNDVAIVFMAAPAR